MIKTSTANKLLKKWTKILRLQDWNIQVEVLNEIEFKAFLKEWGDTEDSLVTSKDTEAATNAGSIFDDSTKSNVYHRDATIAIQNKKGKVEDSYIETLIVHELLHIMLSYISPYQTELEIAMVEQIVLTLEEALLNKEK